MTWKKSKNWALQAWETLYFIFTCRWELKTALISSTHRDKHSIHQAVQAVLWGGNIIELCICVHALRRTDLRHFFLYVQLIQSSVYQPSLNPRHPISLALLKILRWEDLLIYYSRNSPDFLILKAFNLLELVAFIDLAFIFLSKIFCEQRTCCTLMFSPELLPHWLV